MERKVNLEAAVKPILTWDQVGEPKFEGTGFFIKHSENTFLVTARHVAIQGQSWVFDVPRESNFSWEESLFPASIIYEDIARDIAILFCEGFVPKEVLDSESDFPFRNSQVGTMEYARFDMKNRDGIVLNPSHRFGHISRIVVGENPVRDGSLELSFPALKGSSGAPVLLTEPPFSVVGVLLSNAQHELMPIETIEESLPEDGYKATRKYYLRSGIAACRKDLIHCLRRASEHLGHENK